MSAETFSASRQMAITAKRIISKQLPVLVVRHDGEGGDWQFLPDDKFEIEDPVVVSIKEIVKIDPSVTELSDLQEDWQATREYVGAPWERGHI